MDEKEAGKKATFNEKQTNRASETEEQRKKKLRIGHEKDEQEG